MRRLLQTDWPFVILLLALSLFYISGVPYIPFHPDESTQLYMSSDFEAWFTNPSSMFWHVDKEDDPRQRYRELDAPLTKYLLGLGRSLAGVKALTVDWDWSGSWDENINNGAYPDGQLTRVGRATITLLLPISTILIFSIGKHIHGRATGFLAAVLLGTNAVILLHGRRAMAEGTLLLGTVFAVWCILKAHKFPWLAGLGLAIAFNAKQSTLALLPAAMVALIWLPGVKKPHFSTILKNLLIFFFVFTLVTAVLNPIYWRHPYKAIQSAIKARATLMEVQISGTQEIAPEKIMDAFPQRVFVLLLNLYISPPEYGLIENLSPTKDDVSAYIAFPGHNLFRGIFWGAILFVLTLFGLYMATRNSLRKVDHRSRILILLLLATFLQTVGLLAVLQLYWIRYTIPLIPFVCLWIAYGLTTFYEFGKVKSNTQT